MKIMKVIETFKTLETYSIFKKIKYRITFEVI